MTRIYIVDEQEVVRRFIAIITGARTLRGHAGRFACACKSVA